MKNKRREAILRLVNEKTVSTQAELLEALKRVGIETTQATISRDVKDLRLIKKSDRLGKTYYAVDTEKSGELVGKYRNILKHSVISVDCAGNILVIRCYTGTAQAACAALDSMSWEGLVGTLAGDDTIFALCRTEESAVGMKDATAKIID